MQPSLPLVIRFLLCFVIGLYSIQSVSSAIIPVTSLADSGVGSLREGVQNASAGDTLDIQLTGTLGVDSQMVITQDLVILGSGPANLTLDAQDKTRIFRVNDTVTLILSGMTFTRGNSRDYFPLQSGGIISTRGRVEVSDCVFIKNKASSGGAIFLDGFGEGRTSARLENCGFFYNEATIFNAQGLLLTGGAISGSALEEGEAIIDAINCTFSQNEASRSGGAVYLVADPAGGARLTCDHCTITDNYAPSIAGGVDHSVAEKLILSNTIISGNSGPLGAEDLLGGITSLGYNLIGNGALNFTPESTDIMTPDPQVGPLGNHGSPLLTHGLVCGSPAIDAANPASAILSDQRGQMRLGAPDIGAHEWNPDVDIRVLSLADKGAYTLREIVTIACDGDTLDMSGLAGSINLTEPLLLDKQLTWIGNQSQSLSLDGGDSTRLVEIGPNGNLSASWMNFRNARASSLGGGAIQNLGICSLSHCAIIRSRADAGGGIANYGTQAAAQLSLTNCTLSGNRAVALSGGAIDNRSFDFPAQTSLINCTLSENSALYQGGGAFNSLDADATFSIWNTLVQGNSCEEGADLYGSFSSNGHNLVGDSDGLDLSAPNNDLLDVDAQLELLSRDGSSTYIHRLQAGSPAIDAGDNGVELAFDQRGFARVFNGTIDIGAFEYDPANSVDELEGPFQLTVFPNPTEGNITLLFDQNVNEMELGLIGMDGKSWKKTVMLSGQTSWETNLYAYFPTLTAGLYLVSVKVGEKKHHFKLWLK